MGVLRWADAVDIGHGRGRLARDAAASLRRVDTALGSPADVNEAWRSPDDADANYAAYLRYLVGGPWAPIALPGNQSVHCMGYALDTDDTADWQMAIWNDHGWYWTVYRNGRLAERWHLEYFPNRDNHRNDPDPEEDDMYEANDRTRAEQTLQAIRDLSTNLAAISKEVLNGRSQYYGGQYTPIDILLSHTTQALARLSGASPTAVTVELSPEDAAALAQATAVSLAGMMQTNQQAIIDQIRQLPAETIAALKAAL